MCTYGRITLPDKEKEKEKTDKTGYLSDDDITVFSKLLKYVRIASLSQRIRTFTSVP